MLPLTAVPAVIRDALVEQVFTEPGRQATFWGRRGSCSFFILEDPRVETEEGAVRVVAHGEARLGTEFLGGCFSPIVWSGYLEVRETPRLEGWVLAFEVEDSNVYDERREKTTLAAQLWDRIKASVHPRLAAVRIDLGSPFAELRELLPLVLPPTRVPEAERIFGSLRPLRVSSHPAGVVVEAVVEVPEVPPAPPAPEAPLTEEELEAFTRHLDQWDAFVTFAIRELGGRSLRPETRDELLSVLIEARYEILAALGTPSRREDPVRRLFVSSWRRLAPVASEIAREVPGTEAVKLLTFLAAGDALSAFDRLGPSFGIEISADGLRRMARMVQPALVGDPLEYSPALDARLRRFLGFGPPLEPTETTPSGPASAPGLPGRSFFAWLEPPSAEAAEVWARWVLSGPEEVDDYVARVKGLLHQTAQETIRDGGLEGSDAAFHARLLPVTAWQESCWRQFLRKDGEVTFLRSSQGSVGILQINERVWRGFYEVEPLRWNIGYNARAGSEILERYRQLALRSVPGRTGDDLARAIYALYNGGPGQLRRYLSGKAGPRLRRVIDGLFGEKMRTAPEDVPREVARCLVGG